MVANPSTPGLINLGNTCYVNVILQILSRTKDFELFFESYVHSGLEEPADCLKCLLQTLISKMLIFPYGINLSPSDIVAYLTGSSGFFAEGVPQDPLELLQIIVERVGFNPFQLKEVNKVTCVRGCKEETIVPDDLMLGPVMMLGFPNDTDQAITTQSLLDWTLLKKQTQMPCATCGVLQTSIRVFQTAPNYFALMLERFPVENYSGGKKTLRCVVNRHMKLTLLNGTEQTYELYGAITHIGENPNCGHYVSHVVDKGELFLYSDTDVTRNEIDEENVFLVFYKKLINSGKGYNPGSPQISPDLSRERGEIQCKKMRYARRHVKNLSYHLLRSKRQLIICLPKCLKGNTFQERFRDFQKSNKTILYSICSKGSSFLKKLKSDCLITSDFDIYRKFISTKTDNYTAHKWLAEAFLWYIIKSLVQTKPPRYEFIFDLRLSGLVTTVLRKHYDEVKDKIIQSLPRILNKDLFCIDPCSTRCIEESDSFHFSIHDMDLVEPFTVKTVDSNIEKWTFLDNSETLLNHPLKRLLLPIVPFNFKIDLTNQITNFIQEISLPRNTNFYVYLLLIVNEAKGHKKQDLKELYINQAAKFGIYAGCTSSGRYRLDHLKADSKSSVSNFLTSESTVYLVMSTRFDDRSEATKAESKLIGFLLYKKEQAIKDGAKLNYIVLNKRHELVPIADDRKETESELNEFIASGKDLLRFPDQLDDTYEVDKCKKILKEYLVMEIIQ